MILYNNTRLYRIIISIDAYFLIVAGALAGFFDMLSYITGKGVWRLTFYKNPLAIGFFEAHMLAIIIGLFLLRMCQKQDWVFAMRMALVIHLILGVSNIIWFEGFSMVNAEIGGLIATIIHFVFVSLYLFLLCKSIIINKN